MITVQNISKTFKVAKRSPGFGQAVKALFSKEYEEVKALDDISFTVDEGEMVGYIGPNGAGKSTTIKILCGILTPKEGRCLVNGRVPWKERIQHVRDIGVVFGQRSQLWWDVPVADSFELIRDIYKVDQIKYRQNLDELIALLDLKQLLKTPARSLSLGQRMRCEIGASLLHSPKILFLDEPTIGLDAVSKMAVREFIQKRNKHQGTTVILTTHDMQDIEALARRILLIGKGRILLDGSLQQVKKTFSDEKTLVIEYEGARPTLLEGMTIKEESPKGMKIRLNPALCPVAKAISHLSHQTTLRDVSVADISAEEMVARLYKEYEI